MGKGLLKCYLKCLRFKNVQSVESTTLNSYNLMKLVKTVLLILEKCHTENGRKLIFNFQLPKTMKT